MITVTVTGIGQAAQRLQDVPEKLAHGVILEMSQIVFDTMQAGADRHTKKGALFQSVYNRAIPGGREIGHDANRAPHALFVVWGTKPHKIFPRGERYHSYKGLDGKTVRKGIKRGGRQRTALRWAGPGGFIFAKFVKHPGYKGDNYMLRASDEALRRMPEIVASRLKEF